jgi:hypothetical protein
MVPTITVTARTEPIPTSTTAGQTTPFMGTIENQHTRVTIVIHEALIDVGTMQIKTLLLRDKPDRPAYLDVNVGVMIMGNDPRIGVVIRSLDLTGGVVNRNLDLTAGVPAMIDDRESTVLQQCPAPDPPALRRIIGNRFAMTSCQYVLGGHLVPA